MNLLYFRAKQNGGDFSFDESGRYDTDDDVPPQAQGTRMSLWINPQKEKKQNSNIEKENKDTRGRNEVLACGQWCWNVPHRLDSFRSTTWTKSRPPTPWTAGTWPFRNVDRWWDGQAGRCRFFFFFRRYYFCFRLFLFTELYRRRFTASRSYRLVVPQMAPSLVRSPYCSYTSSITFFSLFSERLPEISNPSSSPIYNKISYWDKYNEFGSPMILSIDPGVGTKKKLSDSVSKNI